MRPLSPRTEKRYAEVLLTAFDGKSVCPENLDVTRTGNWGESARNQLRCALTRYYKEIGEKRPEEFESLLARQWEVQKQVEIPAEEELKRFEACAKDAHPAHRVASLLLLYLGLRAEEFCTLPRAAVQRAVETNTLTFTRKGGRESSLDVSASLSLVKELLALPSQVRGRNSPLWTHAGETLCTTSSGASQYAALRRAVQRIAKLAQLPKLSPHKLRHAFASRLNRDGASLFTVQAALNHRSVATTQKYVHASATDIAKHMRGPQP